METVGIWERSGQIEVFLHQFLPASQAAGLEIMRHMNPERLARKKRLSVLLASPDAIMQHGTVLPDCRLLLLPGEAAPLVWHCHTACAMSYGLSPRDSLTLSGTEGGHYAMSIQRELITISSGSVERQELILPRLVKEPLIQLAGVLLLLVLGVPPEDLPELLHNKRKVKEDARIAADPF